MGSRFVEAPLEGLWCADDIADLIAGNKEKMKWRMMIVTAEWVDEGMFCDAVDDAAKRIGEVPASLRLDRYNEGTCAQIMHVGPLGPRCSSIVKLYEEFLPANNLTARGCHHQIYLNDPNRVAPEKWKTVLRQPVR